MNIRSLKHTSEEIVLNTFNEAFSDYVIPFQFTQDNFNYANKRRAIRYDLSIGLFEQKKLVGFIMNSIGNRNNRSTAYNGFTGVIPEYRNMKGCFSMLEHGTRLFRKMGIRQYSLEVICTNKKAWKIYEKNGFQIHRTFHVYKTKSKDLVPDKNLPDRCIIKPVTNPDWNELMLFHDVSPSWQNSVDAIKRVWNEISITGAYMNDRCIGYIAYDDKRGDILQLAVNKQYRRKRFGSGLLKHVCNRKKQDDFISFVNVDSRCNTFLKFADKTGCKLELKQFEMLKTF